MSPATSRSPARNCCDRSRSARCSASRAHGSTPRPTRVGSRRFASADPPARCGSSLPISRYGWRTRARHGRRAVRRRPARRRNTICCQSVAVRGLSPVRIGLDGLVPRRPAATRARALSATTSKSLTPPGERRSERNLPRSAENASETLPVRRSVRACDWSRQVGAFAPPFGIDLSRSCAATKPAKSSPASTPAPNRPRSVSDQRVQIV
jgi:hypothetical protein